MKIEEIENGIKVIISKKENSTLEDLKQNLINELNTQVNNKKYLSAFDKEIELLEIILTYEINSK